MTETDPLEGVEVATFDRLGYVDLPARRARVQVIGEGLAIDGALHFARAAIAEGLLHPDSGRPRLEVRHRDGRSIVIHVPRIADGRAILHALAIDGSQRAATFSVSSPFAGRVAPFSLVIALVPLGCMSATNGAPWSIAFALLVFLGVVATLTMRTKVTVGADQVVLRWGRWRRSIATPAIEHVSVTNTHVHVQHGGRRTSLILYVDYRRTVTQRSELLRIEARQREAHAFGETIAERIDEARSAAAPVDAADELAVPARAGRSIGAWIDELRSLASHQGLRDSAYVADRLWRLVRSVRVEPAVRVAAAVALAPSLDEEGKRELRVAASATASPEVRVALESAASSDDEVLTGALERLTRSAK